MQHVELFGFAGSTYVRTARLVCAEKQIDYQLEPLEFGEESHRVLHPFLRMPVLRIGDTLLYETLAIASYLDESFDGPRLTPVDPLGRARMLQWVSTCCDYLYHDLVLTLLKSDDPTAEDLDRVRRDLEIVDRQLAGNAFLLGAEIYLCDLFLLPMLTYAESRTTTPLLQGLDGLSAWYERLASRASFTATAA